MEEKRELDEFEYNLLMLLHQSQNGWRRDKSDNDLRCIREDSYQLFKQYSKQIQQIKKILTPLLRSHAWHYIRYTQADKLLAERDKLQRVAVKKKGGRTKRALTPEQLIAMMSKEQLEEFVKKYDEE